MFLVGDQPDIKFLVSRRTNMLERVFRYDVMVV